MVFPDSDRHGGRPHHQVEVTIAPAFFVDRLGVDPADGMDLADWLLAPTQLLASLTGGVVLHDPLDPRHAAPGTGLVPRDVWRYVLAASWPRRGIRGLAVGLLELAPGGVLRLDSAQVVVPPDPDLAAAGDGRTPATPGRSRRVNIVCWWDLPCYLATWLPGRAWRHEAPSVNLREMDGFGPLSGVWRAVGCCGRFQ
ncbi:hypothetical protein [Parafrankia soli]|uniref:hypothetical protein n=1 Tax=Parafrankia soli TaxID=2599596 RepID=UPI0034D79840